MLRIIKFFLIIPILFLLLSAMGSGSGSPVQAQAAIPWNCADWKAFAHADRATAILESLAENRGKALYCGVDQSDTFGKAETWAAGEHRNERDNTIYPGERGRFRGFTAAQEGYLTEGKSGITGYGADFIFEFPRPKPQRRRVKYVPVGEVPEQTLTSCHPNNIYDCGDGEVAVASGAGTQRFINAMETFNREVHPTLDWLGMAKAKGREYCNSNQRETPTPYVRNVQIETRLARPGLNNLLAPIDPIFQLRGTTHVYQERSWTATCVKKVKGPRR